MPYQVKVNSSLIQEKIDKAVFNKVKDIAKNKAADFVAARKKEFLDKFANDEITEEILAGPAAASDVDGVRGNLDSFLGFDKGKEKIAIKDLYDYLNTHIFLKPNYEQNYGYTKTNKIFKFKMSYPTLDDLKETTDMSKYCTDDAGWGSGRSWVISIERGIPGLDRYKFGDQKTLGGDSRSGSALQRRNVIHTGANYKPRKYITELIKILTAK